MGIIAKKMPINKEKWMGHDQITVETAFSQPSLEL